jgi:hypothetical protein
LASTEAAPRSYSKTKHPLKQQNEKKYPFSFHIVHSVLCELIYELSTNKFTVLYIMFLLLFCCYMFRRNSQPQGAYTDVVTTCSNKIFLKWSCTSGCIIIKFYITIYTTTIVKYSVFHNSCNTRLWVQSVKKKIK